MAKIPWSPGEVFAVSDKIPVKRTSRKPPQLCKLAVHTDLYATPKSFARLVQFHPDVAILQDHFEEKNDRF
jgi:hypothetical protein